MVDDERWRRTRPKDNRPRKLRKVAAEVASARAQATKAATTIATELDDLADGLQIVPKQDEEWCLKSYRPSNDAVTKNVFQRDSPRGRATLRSFLCEFLVDDARGGVDIRRDIDLRRYRQEAMRQVTNATVQEICVMQPQMTHLQISDCDLITDAAFWALSRHCPNLRSLAAARCHRITRIGLRAVTLGCPKLSYLDVSGCNDVDDAALSAVAAGAPELRELHLQGCANITDDGLAVVARGCRYLETLNVSSCPGVGEFGDRALLALGRFCPRLLNLDMFGCAHVQDAGVVAVANGCPKLRSLRLSGCRELSGTALVALASKSFDLRDLCVAGCKRIKNIDLRKLVGLDLKTNNNNNEDIEKEATLGCRRLMKLDVSGCDDVRASGLAAIAARCPQLRELTLRGCVAVSNDACAELARCAQSQLRRVDVSGCPQVSESGVRVLARSVRGLEKLDVTNCKRVSRQFLINLVEELQFAELARDFVGLQPKKNADFLRKEAEKMAFLAMKAIMIEKVWRGALARIGLRSIKRRIFVHKQTTRFQAHARAGFVRVRVHELLLRRREQLAATWFQATWRGYCIRWEMEEQKRRGYQREKHDVYTRIIQRYYRGHRSRCRVRALRAYVALERLEEARVQAKLEINATKIQRLYRGGKAREFADQVRRDRDARLRRWQLENFAASRIEATWRGHLGRKRIRAIRLALKEEVLKWKMARILEAIVRGKRARRRAAARRKAREEERRRKAVVTIQAAWRANRARFLATLAAAMDAIRVEEATAVVKIQATVRRCLAEKLAVQLKELKRQEAERQRSAAVIQRVLRGHYGRTKFEVEQKIATLRHRAAPLYERLRVLRDEAATAARERIMVERQLARYRKETAEVVLELKEVSRVGRATWDTTRLSGHPQRYQTQFLKERLVEILTENRRRVGELADLVRLKAVAARSKDRLVRQVRRELAPLADGLADKTKNDRIARLRTKVRAEKRAATRIQQLVRSRNVLRALFRLATQGGHAQWHILKDEVTCEEYFWNQVTGETRWTKPLELDFPDPPDGFFHSTLFGANLSSCWTQNDQAYPSSSSAASFDHYNGDSIETTGY